MEKWKVKTIEPAVEFTADGLYNHVTSTVEVECDFIEISPHGVVVFWLWCDELKTKKIANAVFSTHNLISVTKEESDEQTSETTV